MAVLAVILVLVAASWALIDTARHDDPAATTFLIVRSRAGGTASVTWDDVRAIQSQLPSVELAVPYLDKTVPLATAEAIWNTRVVGTTPEYFELMRWHVAAGDRFDAAASRSARKVVVLGDAVVAQLYGTGQSPVGEVVRIRNTPFTVIGVLAHQGTSPQGQDLDDVALVPIEAYAARIDPTLRFRGALLVSAKPPADLTRLEVELRTLLRERHRLAAGDDDDFVIRPSDPE